MVPETCATAARRCQDGCRFTGSALRPWFRPAPLCPWLIVRGAYRLSAPEPPTIFGAPSALLHSPAPATFWRRQAVNKKEFIDAIASQHEPLPRGQAAPSSIPNSSPSAARSSAAARCRSPALGRFSTVKRKGRKDFNPKNREPIRIKVKTVAKFSAGAGLRALLDKKKA
jgi:nucleoid DNA-binding protein